MIKKIRSSIWLKIFLLLTTLLFAVSFLLYGIVMTVMPQSYKSLVTSSYMEQITELADELKERTLNEATSKIYEFGLSHSAAVKLQGEDGTVSFGEEQEMDSNTKDTIAVELALADGCYILTVSMSPGTVNQITQTFWKLLPVIVAVILAISLMASYFVSRFLTKPIIEISNISKRLTALDMTWRCDTGRTDEIGALASNLNTMAAHLDEALTELTSANEKLQADIDQERQQEKMRVDFFRAVSHELKTPITILKGQLEGMIYQVGEYKNREASLRQSLRTVNEMELLVKEILAASRMAGNDFNLTISEVDLSQLILQSCHTWQGVAEDKNQKFIVEIEAQKFYHGDAVLLKKAISNIISNAVTYSPEQATIAVTFRGGELRIENSGISIAADDLKHIFEPFYRGDASHNSKTGGSGLGLYIVKTIFERHNVNYQIESVSDHVCFTVNF